MEIDKKIAHAIENTVVIRPPKQLLATFGTTNIYYYLLTNPVYADVINESKKLDETVIREGRVITERPKVITPSYLFNLEGFSEYARRYLEAIAEEHGTHAPGIFYRYKNEPKDLTITSSSLEAVATRISGEIDGKGDQLSTIIKGVDEMWDVSLLKFIYEVTQNSLEHNVMEMGNQRLFDMDRRGIPRDARLRIETLFYKVEAGQIDPSVMKSELDRWGIFDEYEDRFLGLFRKRK
ncbi:MAG: hypothetical protein NTV30_07315 [Chloroflexi bacterium]|nr:hypothetical protein [Chloroflexota bacterium]